MTMAFDRMRIFSRLPIRVHCWGGFGSQIFACVIAKRLASLFPARKIVLIFHSSGVTRRTLEIPKGFTDDFTVLTQDDFRTSNAEENSIDPKLSTMSKILMFTTPLFERLGLLARLNTEKEFPELRACLYEVRGHYTQILLSTEEVSWVTSCLAISSTQEKGHTQSSIVLHLRLGDLLELKSKSYINLDRLSSAIKLVSPRRKITIFSDSEPCEVKDLLQDVFKGIEYRVEKENVIKVIQEGALSELFIGTNSKISLWIAIIRRGLSLGYTTLLPKEISTQLETLIPEISNTPRTVQY